MFVSFAGMIRAYKGMSPKIPASCYVDESAQIIGYVLLGGDVEDRCLIGMGTVILNGARIGTGSIIAAGTLIPEGTIVEPYSLWMGSPGKFRRKLEERDQEMI